MSGDSHAPHSDDQDASEILTSESGVSVQDALNEKAEKTNVLELNNSTAFTPDADYEPATKKYVDDNAGGASATELSFVNSDLATGILTVAHNLGLTAGYTALVTVVDNTGNVIIPDAINTFATNSFKVDLSGYGIISGTWYVIYITK